MAKTPHAQKQPCLLGVGVTKAILSRKEKSIIFPFPRNKNSLPSESWELLTAHSDMHIYGLSHWHNGNFSSGRISLPSSWRCATATAPMLTLISFKWKFETESFSGCRFLQTDSIIYQQIPVYAATFVSLYDNRLQCWQTHTVQNAKSFICCSPRDNEQFFILGKHVVFSTFWKRDLSALSLPRHPSNNCVSFHLPGTKGNTPQYLCSHCCCSSEASL